MNGQGNTYKQQENMCAGLSISDHDLNQQYRAHPQDDVREGDPKPLNDIPNNGYDDIGGF